MNTEKESVIPDPVFEAIDLHRAAWCAQMATMDLADGPLAREQGRTVTPADVETNERADRLEREAMATLKQIAPTTMAGLKAAIAYLIEWDEGEMGDDAREGLTALLGSPLFETGPQSGDAVRTGDDLDDSVMYDVERMAGIAVRVIGAILDEAQPDAKRENWSLILRTTELERLYFLPAHVHEMAEAQAKRLKAYAEGVQSDAK